MGTQLVHGMAGMESEPSSTLSAAAQALAAPMPGVPEALTPQQAFDLGRSLSRAADRPVPAEAPIDALAKLVDLKGLAKVEPFSGREAEWASWRFRFQNVLGLLPGLDALMDRAAEHRGELIEQELSPTAQAQSHLLWALLVQLCRGRAFLIVRLGQKNCGFAAWNRLCAEYQQPDVVARNLAVMMGLLQPTFPQSLAAFGDSLLDWEWRVAEFSGHSGMVIPEPIQCAVLMSRAPRSVRAYLQSQATDVGTDWRKMRQALQLFLLRHQTYDAAGRASVADEPAVDALWRREDDGPKVKVKEQPSASDRSSAAAPFRPPGKQGARFDGECHYCKKQGHKQSECRRRARDLASGRLQQPAAPKRKSEPSAVATRPDKQGRTCFKCGRKGHFANRCRAGLMSVEEFEAEAAPTPSTSKPLPVVQPSASAASSGRPASRTVSTLVPQVLLLEAASDSWPTDVGPSECHMLAPFTGMAKAAVAAGESRSLCTSVVQLAARVRVTPDMLAPFLRDPEFLFRRKPGLQVRTLARQLDAEMQEMIEEHCCPACLQADESLLYDHDRAIRMQASGYTFTMVSSWHRLRPSRPV